MSNLKAYHLVLLSKQIFKESFPMHESEMFSFLPPAGFMLPSKIHGNVA